MMSITCIEMLQTSLSNRHHVAIRFYLVNCNRPGGFYQSNLSREESKKEERTPGDGRRWEEGETRVNSNSTRPLVIYPGHRGFPLSCFD